MDFLKKHWKTLFIVAAFAFVAYSLRHSVKDFASLPPPHVLWLAIAGLMFMIHYLTQAWGWHLILRSLGQDAPPRLSMRMWYMSMIARWMPGRVWYSASRLLLARQHNLSVTAVSFAMVMELVYILVAGVLVTLAFAGGIFRGLLTDPHAKIAIVAIGAAVFVCGALVVKPTNLLRLYKVNLFKKLMRKLAGEDLDAAGLPTMSTVNSLGLLAYFTGFWLYSGVMFGVLAKAFIPMTQAKWLACIPSFAGSWLVGFFSLVTPAGIGAREGAMWLMLHGALGKTEAGVLAISSRLMMVAAELLSVGIASLLLRNDGKAAHLPAAAQGDGAANPTEPIITLRNPVLEAEP